MDSKKAPEMVQIIVRAPAKTKEVLVALRDWEPTKGVKFTLARRKGFLLIFNVSTAVGYIAREHALKRLEEKGLDKLTGLDVSVL